MNLKDLPPHMRAQAKQQIEEQKSRLAKPLAYPFEIIFFFRLKSINEYYGEFADEKRNKRKEEFWVGLEINSLMNVQTPNRFQYVTITRVMGFGERKFDDGNLEGGDAKQFVDILTKAGFWKDDSPKYVKIEFEQDDEKNPVNGYTKLRIELGDPL